MIAPLFVEYNTTQAKLSLFIIDSQWEYEGDPDPTQMNIRFDEGELEIKHSEAREALHCQKNVTETDTSS